MLLQVIIPAFLFTTSAVIAAAYSYPGYKWSNYPVAIQVEASWPSGWVSPLASSMGSWNNAASPFYFNVGSYGHSMSAQNLGYGQPLATTSVGLSDEDTIVDVDTTMNTYYSWSTSGSPTAYDVQSAVTHELGHWLYLGDLYGGGDTAKTMYYNMNQGETNKRTLEADDLNGINAIYP